MIQSWKVWNLWFLISLFWDGAIKPGSNAWSCLNDRQKNRFCLSLSCPVMACLFGKIKGIRKQVEEIFQGNSSILSLRLWHGPYFSILLAYFYRVFTQSNSLDFPQLIEGFPNLLEPREHILTKLNNTVCSLYLRKLTTLLGCWILETVARQEITQV